MEKLKHPSTFQVFEQYNNLIEDTKGKIFSGLGYEVADNNIIYYKAYFSSKDFINEDFIKKKVNEAQQVINNLIHVKEEIGSIYQLNQKQKDVLYDTINKHILLLQYHQHAIYIEAEKSGYKQNSEEVFYHMQKKKSIEEKLYGPSILEIPYRAKNVAQKLKDLYTKGERLLSDEERSFWKEVMNPILQEYIIEEAVVDEGFRVHGEKDSFISENKLFPLINTLLEIEGLEKNHLLNIQMDDSITEPEIKDNIYHIPNAWKDTEIEEYFEQLGRKDHFKIIKLLKGNASVSIVKGEGETFKHNHIKLPPASNGKYNLTQRVLPVLFDHEIATHVKTAMGNVNNHNISTGGSREFEEGVALFNQHMTTNISTENFYEASIGDIGQFLGEQLDDEELLKALQIIMKKLDTKITLTPEERTRRIRIGTPVGQKGAKRSYMSYGAGRDIIKQLEHMSKTPEGIGKLKTYAKTKYGTKLAFQDVEKIDKILEGIGSLDELKVDYPNFVGKILYRKLFKGKLNK